MANLKIERPAAAETAIEAQTPIRETAAGDVGRATVESTFRIDIDALRRDGLIRPGVRGGCVIRFSGPYHDLDVECETHIDGPWNDWVRLKYEMTDYWTGEPFEIDDKIFLAASRPPFGGLRWWFVPLGAQIVRNNSAPPKWSKLWTDAPKAGDRIGAYTPEQLEQMNQEFTAAVDNSRPPWSAHFARAARVSSRRRGPTT